NALALSLNEGDFGRLFDYFRGYQDIKEGLIRVLHSLSLIEDPTRAFRAARFAARLSFKISKMTLALIDNALKGGFFKNLHPRRVLTELRLIFEEPEALTALERLNDLGLLSIIHPDIKLHKPQRDLLKQVIRVRDWFFLTFGSRSQLFWLVFLLALTENLSQEDLSKIIDNLDSFKKAAKLAFSERPQIEMILNYYRRRLPVGEPKPSEIDKLLSPLSWPSVLFLMAKSPGETLDRAGAAYLSTYRRVKPLCGGADLLALGLPSGPMIQKVLTKLREARLDGEITTLEDERVLAQKYYLELTG
ncbi:MAG: hypothetical protein LBV23_11480, partial [Deltaproteobacteria bacterium]|nr:hypothetical protein [Deltaproteobacteria bacterium]